MADEQAVSFTDYGGKYQRIRKAVHNAGFDEFCQAGTMSQFHKMNIVCESAILNKRFWICIDSGYGVSDSLSIVTRDLSINGRDERVYYKTQTELATGIDAIGEQIRAAKEVQGHV